MRQASEHTNKRPTGTNLGLERLGYVVSWIYRNGMSWYDLPSIISGMVNLRGIPDILVIHCGANDEVREPCGKLLHEMRVTIVRLIWQIVPGCPIVFSQMLPRLSWRGSFNDILIERTRRRINRGLRAFLLDRRCYIICHPDFDDKHPGFFSEDGVHLSFIGLDIFINSLQGGLETFLTKPWELSFPVD